MIGYARRNVLVPIPRFESFEALNTETHDECRAGRSVSLEEGQEDEASAGRHGGRLVRQVESNRRPLAATMS